MWPETGEGSCDDGVDDTLEHRNGCAYISDPECSYVPVFVGSYIQIQIEIFACIFSVIYTYITGIQPRYSTVYMSYDFVICI